MSGFQGSIISLIAGLIVGVIFQLIYLPIPAPGNIPGFMGIFGIWSGSYITQKYFKKGGRK
jgi:XapX domain-containing protein